MRHPLQAQLSIGSKTIRSARTRTGLLSNSREVVAGCQCVSFSSLRPELSIVTSHSEWQTMSAARRQPTRLLPRCIVTMTRGLPPEHEYTTPHSFPGTPSGGAYVEPRIACVPGNSSPVEYSTWSKSLKRLNGRATSFLFKPTYSSTSSQALSCMSRKRHLLPALIDSQSLD